MQTLLVPGVTNLHTPPSCDIRKRVKALINTSCSFGLIFPRLSESKRDNDPFVMLNILEALIEETYFAAFISCWLCSFVLSAEAACLICLTVFVTTRKIAYEECLNLLIPTLASIY